MIIDEVSWPVYKLGKVPPSKDGQVLYYSYKKEDIVHIEVLDDREIPQPTLSLRRIQLMGKVELHKLNQAIFFLGDLVKIAKKGIWFIDSVGKVFEYTKTTRAKLVYKEITKVIRGVGETIIEVKGSPIRFKSLYPPTAEEKYAGLLVLKSSYILYGYYKEPLKPTSRKI